jgi:isopenicillin-N epimerase
MLPIRTEWDLDPDFLTVNHGSFGATPRCVIAAQRAWQDQMERQPTRFMSAILPNALRGAASTLAGFLNTEGNDLAFVDNATTGCNAVLRSLTLRPDDEILILSHAYGAVRNTVRFVTSRAGAHIAEASIPFPDPTEGSLTAAIAAAIVPAPGSRLSTTSHLPVRSSCQPSRSLQRATPPAFAS